MSGIYSKFVNLFGRDNVNTKISGTVDFLSEDHTSQFDIEDDFDYIPVLPVSTVALEIKKLEYETQELLEKIEREKKSSLTIVKKTIEEYSLCNNKLNDIKLKRDNVFKLKITDYNVSFLAEVINFYNRGLMHRLSLSKNKGFKSNNNFEEAEVNPFKFLEGRFCAADLVDFQRYLTSVFSHLLLNNVFEKLSDKVSKEILFASITKTTVFVIRLAQMLLYNFKDLNGFAGVALSLLHPAVKRIIDKYSQLPSSCVKLLKEFSSFLSPNNNYSFYFEQFHKIALSEALPNSDSEQKNSPFPEVPWMMPYVFKIDAILSLYSSSLPFISDDCIIPNLSPPGQKRLDFLLETLKPFALPLPSRNPHPMLSYWLLSLPYLSQDNLWKASDLLLPISPSFLKFLRYPLASSFPYKPLGSYKHSSTDTLLYISASDINCSIPLSEDYGIVSMSIKDEDISSTELFSDANQSEPEDSWTAPSTDPSPFQTLGEDPSQLLKDELETQASFFEDSIDSFDAQKLMDSMLSKTELLNNPLTLNSIESETSNNLGWFNLESSKIESEIKEVQEEIKAVQESKLQDLSSDSLTSYQSFDIKDKITKSYQPIIKSNSSQASTPSNENARVSFACPEEIENKKSKHKRAHSHDVSLKFDDFSSGFNLNNYDFVNKSNHNNHVSSTEKVNLWLPPITPFGNILDAFSPNEKDLLSPTGLALELPKTTPSSDSPTKPSKPAPRRRFHNRHSRTRSDLPSYTKPAETSQLFSKQKDYNFKVVGTASTSEDHSYPIIRVDGIPFADDNLKSISSPTRSKSVLWDAGCVALGTEDSQFLNFLPWREDDNEEEFAHFFYNDEVSA